MALHVVNEARRCLKCKKPACKAGCPIETAIPEMIDLFLDGHLDQAGKMLFDNNPLSIVCSLVCDHERQCEGNCILNKKGMPVHISSIEHYISDAFIERYKAEKAPGNGLKVAIIGSGPAGITIAVSLAQRGYDVTMFDSRERIGGVLQYGIPDFRLPKTILDRYRRLLNALGVRIRPNTTIGGALSVDDLFRDGYKSVFIGTGVWRPNSLRIKGESLGNVHFAIDYLTNPDSYDLGDEVAIIGAGNSAIDAARTAIRKGCRHVTIYGRSKRTAASQREIEYARIDGVEFQYGKIPVELTDDGPIMKSVEFDENGQMTEIPDSTRLYPADSVIIAISQGPKDKIVSSTTGIEVNNRGLVVTNECGSTSRAGVFASGDVVKGAKTVVEAVKYSKMVADAMDLYMQGLALAMQGLPLPCQD
jgi:glutamate synthase (NADPH/NADH) small chain